jgi:GNAT superfamily N-acetyltransferase
MKLENYLECKPKRLFERIKFHLKRYGVLKTVKLAFSRYVLEYKSLIVFERELDKPINMVSLPYRIVIKRFTLNDLERLIEKDEGYYVSNINRLFNQDKLIKRFKKNRCFVAFKGREMVHRTWVIVRKKEALVHSAKTLEKYRNKGIYIAVLMNILSYLKRRNVKKVYIESFSTNLPAIKAILRVGFKEVKRTKLIRCFGVNLFKPKRIITRFE